MRPVSKKYSVSLGWNIMYPEHLQYLTPTGRHAGLDFACPKGTSVIFSVDGILNFKGYKRGFGNCLIIKFWSGTLLWKKAYRLILAHLDSIVTEKNIGEKVGKWELAGYSGASGAYYYDPEIKEFRDFYHLHAEVQEKIGGMWTAINPSFAIGIS